MSKNLPELAAAVVLARASLDARALKQARSALRGTPRVDQQIVALTRGLDALETGGDLPAACAAADITTEAGALALDCVWYAPPTPALVDALAGYLNDTDHRRVAWALDGATAEPVEADAARPGVPAW